MISELAARVFAARDCAHRRHWATKGYAEHVALNLFYDGVVEAIDAVVESYQGLFGPVDDFEVKTAPVKDIAKFLSDEVDWIEANRDLIAQGNSGIGALIDNLSAVYTKALFLLGMK